MNAIMEGLITQSRWEASSGISTSGVTLPELLPKKGTKSEVWPKA